MKLITQLKAVEVEAIERCVPAHMLVLMMEQCQRMGLEIRADVMQQLNVASVAPLSRFDTLSVARCAREVDRVARSLLHDLSPDDAREGLYTCATFALALVEEGKLADKGNQAVLCALLFLEDAKDDKPDKDGQGVVWNLEMRRLETAAKALIRRAMLLGYYHGESVH